jgi:hypothetical protein
MNRWTGPGLAALGLAARSGLLGVPVVMAALTAAPQTARADACLDEVKALFANEMHPFNRKPYRSIKTVYSPEGQEQLVFDNIIEAPLETISGNRGGPFGLVIDREIWTGPTQEGPWTPSPVPSTFPEDRRAAYEAQHALMLANMGDAVCHGEVELDGKTLIHYEYKVHPPKDRDSVKLWGAESDKIWLDPETRQVMRWEQTDFETSFLPGVSKERHVVVFEYDDSIRVDPPQ